MEGSHSLVVGSRKDEISNKEINKLAINQIRNAQSFFVIDPHDDNFAFREIDFPIGHCFKGNQNDFDCGDARNVSFKHE